MNSLTFLNPALLWGLALASIPIIIHLLFRRRFRRVDWAPMKYLKLTIQRNRRRVQLEQLLLLAMRVSLLALLFFLVARPVLHASGLGSWLGGSSRTSQILLIDDSLSMGLLDRGKSAFDRARDLAGELTTAQSPNDRLTLALATQPTQPLLREVEGADASQVRQLLGEIPVSAAFASWRPTLESLDELVRGSTYPLREVTLITDLQQAGWEEPLDALAENWSREQVRLRIFDLGGLPARQLALVSLVQQDRLAMAGGLVRWEAEVRNGSSVLLENVEATWLVDGAPTQVVLPSIPPGESVQVPLSATFQEPGRHFVSLKLPDDDLPGDDQRWHVVDVRERVDILLVDGEPSGSPLLSETDFLGLALSLAMGDNVRFDVHVVTDSEWAGMTGAIPDLLVLANVAQFTREQAERIRRLAEGGTGVVIFPGDQVDPDNYNQLLHQGGGGPLPAALEFVSDEPATGLTLEDNSPNPLDALRQLNPAVLERIRAAKHYQVKLPEAESGEARVLARWNNSGATPAVVEKRVGAGSVALWTVTADKAWSDWPLEPSYVLAQREAAKALARSTSGVRELTAGQPLRRSFPSDQPPQAPTAEIPGQKEPLPLTAQPSPAGAGNDLVLDETRLPGLYTLHWTSPVAGLQSDRYAVNPDVRESALARISADDIKRKFPGLEVEVIASASGDDRSIAVRGQEIWRPLALCLFGLMCAEAAFATWTGRQH